MPPFEPIAIVGQSCVLPGALAPEELWEAVAAGRDLISRAPQGYWRVDPELVLANDPRQMDDHTWHDRGGYVDLQRFEQRFSAEGFALPAEQIMDLDPLVHWVLHTAREALGGAGCPAGLEGLRTRRAGAIFGNLSYPSASLSSYAEAVWLDRLGRAFLEGQARTLAGIERPHPLNRFMSGLPAHLLARAVGLSAGAFALDAACSSSLYAVKLACDWLHDRRADLMLAGGVNRADDLFIHIGFCALQAMSRSGQSRPFHREADGLVPAEGAAFVALRRLEDAVARGDSILGVIRAVGLSNDGKGRGMLAPCPDGQERAIRQAYQLAGLDPAAISLVECHATGTKVGDVAEVLSTARVFEGLEGVPIGSLKSNLGHLVTASGVAALIKVLSAMKVGIRPPTLHADDPFDELGGGSRSPLRLLHEAEPWSCDGPRRAAVSNFGFGGNNAHLIVEQWEPASTTKFSMPRPSATFDAGDIEEEVAVVGLQVIAASAGDRASFARALLSGASCLSQRPDGSVAGLAGPVELPLTGLRFPPVDLDQTLAQQLLILKVALLAMEELRRPLPADRTGVLVGMQCDAEVGRYGARLRLPQWARQWSDALGAQLPDAERQRWIAEARDGVGSLRQAAGVVGAMPNIVANRLNSQLDLRGPSFTVSAEEASGLVCLELAIRALRAGELDAALVGAVDICCEPVQEAAAKEALAESQWVPGDAAALVVLKRLDDARRDGDHVYAVFPSTATATATATASATVEGEPVLRLGLGGEASDPITPLFGHAHAASGLLQVLAAVLSCEHRASPAGAGRPPVPWWPEERPRWVEVCVEALGGASLTTAVQEDRGPREGASPQAAVPLLRSSPLVHLYSGADREEVLHNLEDSREGDAGPARLALLASDPEQLEERRAQARALLELATEDQTQISDEGITFWERPLEGELAFVFTGPAGVYPGMGRELLLGLPELLDRLFARCRCVERTGRWIYDDQEEHDPATLGPHEKLWGSSFLSQLHTELSRHVLGLSPSAAIGFCSGETNALFALGAWRDLDDFFPELLEARVFSHEIAGDFAAIRRAWGARPDQQVRWVNWRILAPEQEVLAALEGEPQCQLTIISAPGDVVIGGQDEACQRVVSRIGKSRAYPLGYDVALHCPELQSFAGPWRELHHRTTHDLPGVRFYSSAACSHYRPTADAAADALLGMALSRVDFPRVIERAYADGVRFFVEHGPRDGCTKWIGRILGDRAHLAVALDRGGRSSLEQAVWATAQLAAAGVAVDHAGLNARLDLPVTVAVTSSSSRSTRSYPAHPEPVVLPTLSTSTPENPPSSERVEVQVMAPAPRLPSAMSDVDIVIDPTPAGAPAAERSVASAPNAWMAVAHREFLERQAEVHQQFLQMRQRSIHQLASACRALGIPADELDLPLTAPGLQQAPPPTVAVARGPGPVGPTFNREQLIAHASGKISSIFGPLFEKQDGYERQVRLPEPPLLLVDRVTGLEAEPGSMGKGIIWTETDVRWDDWYLNDDGTMPAGIVVESGQADLMLISYLGIDFHNQGERVYRLLGCELTNYGTLPRPGDTLCYEIHVDGHAKVGDVRLFFFHYDCRVDGELRLKVRNAQAGFFSDEELANSGGVLWDPEEVESEIKPRSEARVDPPAVCCTRSRFSAEQVRAFSEGRVCECFGPGFELAETHTRTPKIQSGQMLLLQEVTHFDPEGGPWGRGYLRVRNDLSPDDWYLPGHFKSDPCMPGTLMCEGCLQAMALYLTAMGYTCERDGWRFDPVPDESYKLQCRGQVTPSSRELIYEVFVEEVIDGPIPTIFADILGTSDGLKIFHGRRMGLRLIPDWPMTSMPDLLADHVEPKPVARVEEFHFDYRSLLACAWGRPSEAFGEMARVFDGIRHIARLPGPPYHFMSRVTRVEGQMGSLKTGASIELEYDIPPEVWYFSENGEPVMPFCVLLEAVLQPCGWLAVFIGCPGSSDKDLYFRNLDGTGTVHAELLPGSGTLRTRTTLTSISKMGDIILVSFEVECLVGDRQIYSLNTSFGFFPAEALASQVGLPTTDEQCAQLEEPCGFSVDLTRRPARYCTGALRLPGPMLLMLDRVTGYWPEGGKAGIGRLRAEKEVNVSEWFFKAHFFQDPVQPGSLGLEAMIQLLKFYMIHEGLHRGIERPRFEPIAIERPFTWKYRGQVTPDKQCVTVELELLERGEDERGPYAVAESSLWVDGLRIYHTPNLALRLVSSEGAPSGDAYIEEEVLAPEQDAWLADHRPNWTLPTLPLMSMLDRMAGAALKEHPDQRVVGARDVRVTGWLIFDGPRRLRAEVVAPSTGSPHAIETRLLAWREAKRVDLSRFEPVAEGTILLDSAYPPEPAPLPPLSDARRSPDPYASGALFHGPAFHLLRRLEVGAAGSTAVLDAGAGDLPFGLLNQALMDGAVHGILHDELHRWCAEIPSCQIAYPYRILELNLHGPPLAGGEVRCETRFDGFDGDPRFPVFRIQLIQGERVFVDLRLSEVLIPMGPHADDRQKRIDFRDGRFLPGAGLSRFEVELTKLTEAEVRSRDWLKGSVAVAYGLADRKVAGEELVRQIAIKDHVSQRAEVHPARVSLTSDGRAGIPDDRPLTRFPLTVTVTATSTAAQDGPEVVVADDGSPRLDLEYLRSYGRRVSGIGPWIGEDFSLGLCQRFVGSLALDDPEAVEQVRGRSVLYLGNHQAQVESMLFPMVTTAYSGVHIVTIAKEQHRTAWIGPLSTFSSAYPGVEHPRVIVYFDQRIPQSMFQILQELKLELTSAGHSVFVHVEGELSRRCRRPVERLSSVFVDLALELELPIVPVRLSGALPVEELSGTLDFPLGYARQDYILGRPVLPETLRDLPLVARRDRVLEALNSVGPPLSEEAPNRPDPIFAQRVEAWRERLDLPEVQAVVLAILEGLEQPSEQTLRLLEGIERGRLQLTDDASGRWQAEVVRWLCGERAPEVEGLNDR